MEFITRMLSRRNSTNDLDDADDDEEESVTVTDQYNENEDFTSQQREDDESERSEASVVGKENLSYTQETAEDERSLLSQPRSEASSQRPTDNKKSILKRQSIIAKPSYKARDDLNAVLETNAREDIRDLNSRYNRTRRYDTAGKYRIGPTFITKSRLAYLDAHKPAKLSVVPDPLFKSLEFGLLTYLWTFTDQHDKQEIDLAFLQSLIDSGVNINCADEHGQTALHAIVRDWHPDVALFAVRNNADVNAQDKMGRSPLHLAAAINCVDIARILLLNGARVNIETKSERQTPMHFAAKYNSLDTMKLLIKFQASITQRDAHEKTVLFLAAEQGSTETAQFLLDIGAPTGIYDIHGNSAIACLLEKMPHVAYRALHQFVVTNMTLKQSDMYLMYLENYSKSKSSEIQKSPLEIITIYNDIDLVMHPVIQKAISVKWKLIGRMDTIRKLSITLVYQVCWMVLAYTFSDENAYYKPWATHAWKIVFEVLILLFAVYFFYKDVAIKKDAVKYHHRWMEWWEHLIRSNYVNCHPAWPGDRENLEAESERVRSVPSLAGKQKLWFAYEWLMLLVLFAIIVTRILTMTIDSRGLFITHKCIFGAGLIFSSLRVLKIINRFHFFSVFLKMAGLVLTVFLQIFLLYMQFYIPFVAAFWLSFGGKFKEDKIQNVNDNSTLWLTLKKNPAYLSSLDSIFFRVFSSSFGQDLLKEYVVIDKINGQILLSLYHILVTFILFSVFIALVTSKFTTQYTQCVAEASLLQASIVLQLEHNLNKAEKAKLGAYYKKYCNPLVVQTEAYTETVLKRNALSQLRLAERRLTGIENIVNEAEDRYLQNDRKTQTILIENIERHMSDLHTNENVFSKILNTGLKDIAQKQDYMNKYLPKLLKLST